MDNVVEPEFISIMRDRLAAFGGIKQALADELNMSRTTISLVLSGKYGADTSKIEAAVMAAYTDRVACPHLDKSISQTDCAGFSKRLMPISNPPALRHWTACRACPHSHNEEHGQ